LSSCAADVSSDEVSLLQTQKALDFGRNRAQNVFKANGTSIKQGTVGDAPAQMGVDSNLLSQQLQALREKVESQDALLKEVLEKRNQKSAGASEKERKKAAAEQELEQLQAQLDRQELLLKSVLAEQERDSEAEHWQRGPTAKNDEEKAEDLTILKASLAGENKVYAESVKADQQAWNDYTEAMRKAMMTHVEDSAGASLAMINARKEAVKTHMSGLSGGWSDFLD